MARERLVDPGPIPQEEQTLVGLRPQQLEDYVGQRAIVDSLKVALSACGERSEPLEHVLLHGPPGLGKTTLAHIVRNMLGVDIFATSGPALQRVGDLMGILTNLDEGDVFFIDEIHRLTAAIEEYLYPAMEDFTVDFVVDRGPHARILKVPLKRFTVVGATTMSGLLSRPLRDRFGLTYRLEFYSVEELTEILRRSGKILQVELSDDSPAEIARRARGTPRVANRLLKRVRDYAQVYGDGFITAELAKSALEMEGVDELGLDRLDRAVLSAVVSNYNGGPVGLEAIAATLNEDANTLAEVVEPFLLKIGLLARTPKGRKATSLAYEHLKAASPASEQAQLRI